MATNSSILPIPNISHHTESLIIHTMNQLAEPSNGESKTLNKDISLKGKLNLSIQVFFNGRLKR